MKTSTKTSIKTVAVSSLCVSLIAAAAPQSHADDTIYYEPGAAYVAGCAQGGFKTGNGSKGGLRFTFRQPQVSSSAIISEFKQSIKAQVRTNNLGVPIQCGNGAEKKNPVCLDGLFVCDSEVQQIIGGTSVCPEADQKKIPILVDGAAALSMYSKYLAPRKYHSTKAPGLQLLSFSWDDEVPLKNIDGLVQRVDQMSRDALTSVEGGLLNAVFNFNPIGDRKKILKRLFADAGIAFPGFNGVTLQNLSEVFNRILQAGGFTHTERLEQFQLAAFMCEKNDCPAVPAGCVVFTNQIDANGCGIYKDAAGSICERQTTVVVVPPPVVVPPVVVKVPPNCEKNSTTGVADSSERCPTTTTPTATNEPTDSTTVTREPEIKWPETVDHSRAATVIPTDGTYGISLSDLPVRKTNAS